MKDIYLDNSATTPVCEEAKKAMLQAMEIYGNPSSLHSKGFEASKMITDAKNKILSSLFVRNGKQENLIFTASGTEADNLALMGVAYAKTRRATRIITTDSEHSAIENTLIALENKVSRDFVLELIEKELGDITFTSYPLDDDSLLDFRAKVNGLLK